MDLGIITNAVVDSQDNFRPNSEVLGFKTNKVASSGFPEEIGDDVMLIAVKVGKNTGEKSRKMKDGSIKVTHHLVATEPTVLFMSDAAGNSGPVGIPGKGAVSFQILSPVID